MMPNMQKPEQTAEEAHDPCPRPAAMEESECGFLFYFFQGKKYLHGTSVCNAI